MKRSLALSFVAVSFVCVGCGIEDPSVGVDGAAASGDAIVGGSSYSGLPAIGALIINVQGGQELCTATLISPTKVLTAGHCSQDVVAADAFFIIGADVNKPDYTLKVASIEAHPSFSMSTLKNDIGLVTLAEPAPASVTPLPVLASMSASYVGKSLFFVGYGVDNGTSQTGAGVKRAVSMAISKVSATQFAYSTKGKNTCNGDSGGPALVKSGGKYFVAGVTSYGDQTCVQYGVDTRADMYQSFLGVVGVNP